MSEFLSRSITPSSYWYGEQRTIDVDAIAQMGILHNLCAFRYLQGGAASAARSVIMFCNGRHSLFEISLYANLRR